MKKLILLPVLLFLFACTEENTINYPVGTRFLSLDGIKHEYAIADSLNRLSDKSKIDTTTIRLGVDERNGKMLIRTCQTRSFGCLLFSIFYTILYENCDSVCCEKNGNWLVDYAGFAGIPSPVGCEPDTTNTL
uniref:hypothetical protein n=1 Tax=uncultured Draconibacterium sp. TaxID=1573823 RepID=UPI003217380F